MRACAMMIALLLLGWSPWSALHAGQRYRALRQQMVTLIEQDVRLTRSYIDKDVLNPDVMQALASVPRHEFVPERQKPHAYDNRPLPIGYGQTISQPYIVALMTDLVEVTRESRVLEVGTGSGYQAAVLAQLTDHVYTIEIIEPLAREASKRFQRLRLSNIRSKTADGYYGWPDHAPFDAIVVTAAASHVPPPLIKQLARGGRMIIPVGDRFMTQHLLLITKSDNGRIQTRQILPVRFVPLTGGH